jgi:hypothetical protein
MVEHQRAKGGSLATAGSRGDFKATHTNTTSNQTDPHTTAVGEKQTFWGEIENILLVSPLRV